VKLAELQRYFASAATSGSGPLPELDRVFIGNERLSAKERLAIYNRSYFYRLLDALSSVFAQTKRVLGDSDFERLGLAYVARHPSEQPAVERFGRAFSEYLAGAGAPAVVVDLASLEWARLCALVAANPKSVARVHGLDPKRFPGARLRFVPSFQRLELDLRALSAFAGEDLPGSSSSRRCRGVAVWRNQHVVRHQVLDPQEWTALASAANGAHLGQVCAAFDSGSQGDDVRQAFRVLSDWFARQWLETVEYDEASGS
jgi:hypothetical protein